MADKQIKSEGENHQADKNELMANRQRRKVLQWTAPMIAVVNLPAHAQSSETTTTTTTIAPVLDSTCTEAMPVASVTTGVKCSGDATAPDSQGILNIKSSGPVDIKVESVTLVGSPAGHSISVAGLPAMASASTGIDVSWSGPATDGGTCLPAGGVAIEVTYLCSGSNEPATLTINLASVFATAP